ncbi:MAG: diguanylate cyclase [Gammaproteobacteria bacterium]|nr:MAG: diguanylate cyclase [Gammaproteobacteria bacterium]
MMRVHGCNSCPCCTTRMSEWQKKNKKLKRTIKKQEVVCWHPGIGESPCTTHLSTPIVVAFFRMGNKRLFNSIIVALRAAKGDLNVLTERLRRLSRNKVIPATVRLLLLLSIMDLVGVAVAEPREEASQPLQPGVTVSLRLKWFHQFQFAGYYAALEQGFYSEEGLNVHLLERDLETSVVDDVVSGRVNFGVADSSLIVARMNGAPVVMLNPIFQHSPMVLISLAKNNILGPSDLAGKTVMYQMDVDDAAIIATLNEVGLGQGDIISVPHRFDDWALLNTDVTAMSAYISNQPYLYRQKGIKVNILDPANYGIDFYGDNFFTSEEMIREQPQVVAAFRRASLRGWQYAIQHPQEVIDTILRKYQTGKTREQLEYEAQVIRRMIQSDLIDIGMINRHRFDRIADIYRERGRVPLDANLDGFFADDLLAEDARPSLAMHWAIPLVAISVVIAILMLIINQRLQKRVSQKTRDAEEAWEKVKHYLSILDRHACVLRVDEQLQVQYISAAFCTITGYDREELQDKSHELLMSETKNGPRLRQMLGSLSSGHNWQGEVFLKRKSGKQLVMDVYAEPVMEGSDRFAGYNAVFQDMTQKKNAELLSITDALTGLYNRNKLDELLLKECKLVNRGSPVFSVILLDIDHFKHINDDHGHLVGDQVLKVFAGSLKCNVRATDSVGRWGGEEFMIICANTSLLGAEKLAEMLRNTIERARFPDGIHATSSFGVAEYFPGESIDSLIKRADEGLYWAKNNGRNCVHVQPCQVGNA